MRKKFQLKLLHVRSSSFGIKDARNSKYENAKLRMKSMEISDGKRKKFMIDIHKQHWEIYFLGKFLTNRIFLFERNNLLFFLVLQKYTTTLSVGEQNTDKDDLTNFSFRKRNGHNRDWHQINIRCLEIGDTAKNTEEWSPET